MYYWAAPNSVGSRGVYVNCIIGQRPIPLVIAGFSKGLDAVQQMPGNGFTGCYQQG